SGSGSRLSLVDASHAARSRACVTAWPEALLTLSRDPQPQRFVLRRAGRGLGGGPPPPRVLDVVTYRFFPCGTNATDKSKELPIISAIAVVYVPPRVRPRARESRIPNPECGRRRFLLSRRAASTLERKAQTKLGAAWIIHLVGPASTYLAELSAARIGLRC